MSVSNRFTVVFEGDLRKIGKNPFKIKSDFGEPVAVAMGDALEELDQHRDEAASNSSGICISKAFGGEWCVGKCRDSRDCTAQPTKRAEDLIRRAT